MARDIVRALQEGRKNAGFQISDRINVTWSSESRDVVETMRVHGSEIAGEILALGLTQVNGEVSGFSILDTDSDIEATFGLQKT